MTFQQGLTTFRVGEPIVVENLSTPGFDEYILFGSRNGEENILDPQFLPGEEITYAYANEGVRQLKLTASKVVQGLLYTAEKSVTFDVGYAPGFSLVYEKREDQSENYSHNYVIAGETFSFVVSEGNTATSPKTYIWNYGGAITFSSPTAATQQVLFNSFGNKFIGLTVTNRFGTGNSEIMFKPINTPLIGITGTPTFGVVLLNTDVNLRKNILENNGHSSSEINYIWIVSGQSFTGSDLNYTLNLTGTVGITLFYQSKILVGLSGNTYAEYSVINPITEIPIYYDPTVLLGFDGNPDSSEVEQYASEISYYSNLMKQYGTEYRYINNSISIHPGTSWSSQTVPGQIARYLYYRNSLGWTGPVMTNVEYPWLTMLQANEVDENWRNSVKWPQVSQEATRQGVELEGLTLGGFRQLAVRCWRDLNDGLSAAGCPYWIHYASTGLAFHSFRGIPYGMLKLNPIPGLTQPHFYYQANTSWSPTMRKTFDDRIAPHTTGINHFNDLMRAQSNAPAHGPAAYSFAPNSSAGFCGAPYWRNERVLSQPTILRLIGFSGGVIFVNGGTVNPIDYTEETLREAVRVTSAEMWLEYYRACVKTVEDGLCEPEHLPTRYAAIVSNTIGPLFRAEYPGGLWMSKNKWYGALKKDPERTAEDEIAAIYKNNIRTNYSDYPEVKKPDEIWVWNASNYYHVSLPRLNVLPINQWINGPTLDTINEQATILMIRNAQEIEFFGRPELPPGSSLWYAGSTLDTINYYYNNSLPNSYWQFSGDSQWWGFTGGTLGNLLPHPCNLNRNSPLANWLNFNAPITTTHIVLAIKHKLSQDAVDYLMHARQKLNNGVCCKSYNYSNIFAGDSYVIAVTDISEIRIFGNNQYNIINPASFYDYSHISAGPDHAIGIKNDGSVVSWGRNQYGQTTIPPGLTGTIQIAAGKYHSLALKSDGGLTCWGWNGFGQCNIPSGLTGVTSISAGLGHNLAIRENGTVSAWGYNYDGQTNVPPGLSSVKKVSAGYYHSVAMRQDGTVVCWGMNDHGQCNIPAGLTAADISAGGYHTLILLSGGGVTCFGRNDYGQCNIPTGLTAIKIAAGKLTSFAINLEDDVIGWGNVLTNQQSINDNTCQITNKSECDSIFGNFYLTENCSACYRTT